MSEPARETVPYEIFTEVAKIQTAMGDLVRALISGDDNYIVRDLNEIDKRRRMLVNACQTWRPELRISA